jgi:hydroxyethylthiazole kinase-like uncharacterized protein yjeF
MLILSAEQLKQADLYTIKNEPVSSLELMERASEKCAEYLCLHFSENTYFLIVCGPGNNGGDGLVIARLLKSNKKKVHVILIGDNFSEENKIQQQKVSENRIIISDNSSLNEYAANSEIIVDCIFGYGLKRKPEGVFDDCISKMNLSGKPIISIDIPSGLFTEGQTDFSTVIKATVTLTFQFQKLCFLLPDSGIYAGKVEVVDIGLLYPEKTEKEALATYVTSDNLKKCLPKRNPFSHKGTYGHAFLIGGMKGKTGAMIMSTRSCLRTGAGLTTVFIPEKFHDVLAKIAPEAMLGNTTGEDYLTEVNFVNMIPDAIGIGPGMGTNADTIIVLKKVIDQKDIPKVLDADALNLISQNKMLFENLNESCIITPHPGEFKRLAGDYASSLEMIDLQKAFSKKYKCIVVLKNRFTSVTDSKGNLYFNSTGNPGLAKGGSGDTLTGIITALLAQKLSCLEAALTGVFIHGLAADLAVEKINERSLLASDVTDFISPAIDILQK